MMTPSSIQRLSWEEKLRALEELWDSVAREGDRYESPPWHEQALKETERRNKASAEQPMDWADAKRELRRP
jgi:Putative addiction module component